MCTPDRNYSELGTEVVLDTVLQPTDFGFKTAKFRIRVGESVPKASPESAYTNALVSYCLCHWRFNCTRDTERSCVPRER